MRREDYTDFKRHYESLPTEQLLRIAATSDLVPDASMAMKAELASRRLEIEMEDYKIHIGPTSAPPPKHLGLLDPRVNCIAVWGRWIHCVGLELLFSLVSRLCVKRANNCVARNSSVSVAS